ncbi:two-component regulator propeller domain-containing protein [Lewinella sp. IMCC34191]|uniref:hybrid sensor histidine kinase/response regulator n=1 Tax=Lewinella sp. IMCC34191 TaxID=2259172 RepID=UPI000E2691EB|nr:two-component regulator propeller domain-containing protein [Lewinella sp. IMCC34191]
MFRAILTAWLLFIFAGAGAQERFPFRELQRKDGLSQNSVIGIAQDGKGFMWFGTRDGLNRYDGAEFRVYRAQADDPHSLIFNDIHTLYYDDPTDGLWVGTTRGLCRYRQKTDDFVVYGSDSELGDTFVQFIYRDDRNILWVGTEQALYRYEDRTDRFVRLQELPDQSYRVMAQDDSGQYYVGTSRGLFRLRLSSEGSTGRLERMSVESNRDGEELYVQDLLPEPGGFLWVATRYSGLHRLNLRTGEVTPYLADGAPGALTDNNVRAIEWGQDGSLWAGTFVGLNRLEPGKYRFENYDRENRLSNLRNHSIHSLFTDRRGTLWMGSYFGGVAYYDRQLEGVRHYSRQRTGLNADVVSAFAEAPNGDLWVGTEGGGLNYYDRRADTLGPVDTGHGLESNNIKSLLLDGNRLWIGTYQGRLVYLDITRREVVREWSLAPDSIRGQLTNVYDLMLRNDTLWIANYGIGLTLLDLRTGASRTLTERAASGNRLVSDQCRSIFEDRDGNVWVATQEGVSRITARPEGKLRISQFLPDQVVYALGEDREGHIWAGTYGQGLFLIDPARNRSEAYREGGPLSGSTIYSILRDTNGLLWVSGSLGVAGQDSVTGHLRTSDTPYNLKEQEYRINAAHASRSGDLFFGGTEGLTVFNPDNLYLDVDLPPVVFTKLQVANQEVRIDPEGGLLKQSIDHTEELTLPYDNANFSLSFAPLDFLAADHYRFAYRLEGLDENWIDGQGRTTVSYTLQNAGDYRFRVRVFGDGQHDRFVERSLDITVLPPPWRSWYAYLAYALLGGFLLAAIMRHAYLQHRLRQEELTKQQQEAIHQAKLRFFTNITHELRTPLTLMLGPLESVRRNGEVRGDTAKRLLTVENNSRRLLRLVNELLSFRKLNGQRDTLHLEGYDMVAFCQDIVAAFQAYAATSQKQLRFVSDQERYPMSFDRDKLEKVMYNLLANAFKFTGEGGQITLRLRREGTKMFIEVSDDGEGIPQDLHEKIFARFFERQSLTSREGTGIGLAVAREYVEMHGGEITVESTPGRGSTFRLWLPLRPPLASWSSAITDAGEAEVPREITELRERLAAGKDADEKPPLLLIVEDNEEIRDYIESVLVEDYRLVTAVNGREGLERARADHPDLVISDVMMPEMDGIALCAALKQDIQTSHIPIILLTAKSSDLQKLEGLEIGANDYVTKPFSPRELQLRVQNLLVSIRSARDRTGRTLRLEPAEVQVTSADADFLERAIDAVTARMDDTDYKVDDLARDLAVSRALLFTKMKAITGHTPNNFMKLLRMKRAAQLLATGEFLVAEVAAQVGYRDVKYFSSSFAKEHGCNPSVYGCQETGQD